MSLYHFTCEHGHAALRDHGTVLPVADHAPAAAQALLTQGWPDVWVRMSWFTDLPEPIGDALGLTSNLVVCDRTQYRYTAAVDAPLRRWLGSPERRSLPRVLVDDLEHRGLPMHWWIATEPVAVAVS